MKVISNSKNRCAAFFAQPSTSPTVHGTYLPRDTSYQRVTEDIVTNLLGCHFKICEICLLGWQGDSLMACGSCDVLQTKNERTLLSKPQDFNMGELAEYVSGRSALLVSAICQTRVDES